MAGSRRIPGSGEGNFAEAQRLLGGAHGRLGAEGTTALSAGPGPGTAPGDLGLVQQGGFLELLPIASCRLGLCWSLTSPPPFSQAGLICAWHAVGAP